jgi:hypothetical protein
VKPRFLLAASLLFVLTLIWAGSSQFTPAVSAFHPGAQSVQLPADCDGEPCDAVVRGHRAFFDRELDGWARTAAPAPIATWRATISSSRPRMSRPGSDFSNCAAEGIRTPTIRCSGR